jgi:SAM-dependent methyltransferase
MHIAKLYNKVAGTYNQDLSAQVLNTAKQKALQLALEQCRSFNSILALGMGDGSDLLHYIEHYPFAELHGLDISVNMLEKARVLLNCQIHCGDINHASKLLDKQTFDFIIAHFVTAYVPLASVLAECKKLTSKAGLISIVTNTMGSFPVAQSLLSKLEASPNPFNKLVVNHIRRTLKTVYVPYDLSTLKKEIETRGFKLLAIEEEKIEIYFDSEEDIFDFFIKGGWFVSGIAHPFLTYRLICRICSRLIHKNFSIPYKDQMTIVIAIAEKI